MAGMRELQAPTQTHKFGNKSSVTFYFGTKDLFFGMKATFWHKGSSVLLLGSSSALHARAVRWCMRVCARTCIAIAVAPLVSSFSKFVVISKC
jgi:hypothetical protein